MICLPRRAGIVGLTMACSLWTSCAQSSSTEILNEQRTPGTEPLQVAILPVANEDPGPSWLYYAALPLIYAARLVVFNIDASPPGPEVGASALRNFAYLSLEYSRSEIKPVPLPLVDDAIAEFGPDAYEDIARKTGADWVVRLTLEEWSSTWYVLETRHDVAARFELFDPHATGEDAKEPLLVARITSDDGAGLSGIPTGLFSLAAAPLAGVDSGPLIDLVAQVGVGVGVLVGGLGEEGEITDGPDISDVTIRNNAVGEDFGRLEVECSAPPETQMSFAVESLPGPTSLRPVDPDAEPVEGLIRYRGTILGRMHRDLGGRRVRLNAYGVGTRRSSLVLRVPGGPEREAADSEDPPSANEATDGRPSDGR